MMYHEGQPSTQVDRTRGQPPEKRQSGGQISSITYKLTCASILDSVLPVLCI